MEPLRQDIIDRLAITSEWAKRPRRADMPILASTEISVDLRSGERHLHRSLMAAAPPAAPERAQVIRRFEQTAVCPVCKTEFVPTDPDNPGHARKYCTPDCTKIAFAILRANRTKGDLPQQRPINVKAECAIAVSAVCAVFKVGQETIMRPTRGNKYATVPRLMAYALIRELRPEASTNDIGRAFGRDHSSILSGISAHKRRLGQGSYSLRWKEALALCVPQQDAA